MICEINVNESCIGFGLRIDCHKCPVALAIQPHLKADVYFSVYEEHVSFIETTNTIHVDLPPKVTQWIVKFDMQGNRGAEAFTFDLDIPDKFLRTKP